MAPPDFGPARLLGRADAGPGGGRHAALFPAARGRSLMGMGRPADRVQLALQGFDFFFDRHRFAQFGNCQVVKISHINGESCGATGKVSREDFGLL